MSASPGSEARWFHRDGNSLTLLVHAQPGARRTEIQGQHGDALKIRVAAPPVDGAANSELRKFLANAFAVPLRNIALTSGASSRNKRFSVEGSSIDPLSLMAAIARE